MRRLLISVFLLTFILSLQFSTALADKEVTIKRIEATPAPISVGGQTIIGDEATQTCTVGNVNPAQWAIEDWALPPEEYKLAFDPLAGDCATECPVPPGWGFEVTSIHIHIQVDAACTLIVAVDVEEATYPTSPDCPEPGPLACASGLYQVALTSAGGWLLNIPITCDCLSLAKEYLLSVYFESSTGAIDLVTDAIPTNCTSWNNWGAGWKDLVVEYGFPGNLRIWADAECCSPPVPTENTTWGVIKSLYEK